MPKFAGPSAANHCSPCEFQNIPVDTLKSEMRQGFQANMDAEVTQMHARSMVEHTAPPVDNPRNTPPAIQERHEAAAWCAQRIVRGECSKFKYSESMKRVYSAPGLQLVKTPEE